MKQVFISYSTDNEDRAAEICRTLEKNGISCWMGRWDIPGGDNYTEAIIRGINECTVFVLVLSESAQKSKYVFRELDQAIKKGKTVIPYILEDIQISDRFDFLISSCQGIKAFDRSVDAEQELVTRVRELCFDIKGGPRGSIFAQKPKRGGRRKIIVCPHCKSKRLKDSTSVLEYTLENPDVGAILVIMTIAVATLFVYFLLSNTGRLDLVPDVLSADVGTLMERFRQGFFERISEMIDAEVPVMIKKAYDLCILMMALVVFIIMLEGFVVLYTGLINDRYCKKIKKNRYLKGIDVWTFRCDNCNRKFRKRIAIEEQANYYIKDYVRNEEPELLEDFLVFLKAVSKKIWKPFKFDEQKNKK